ncbi:unnamed protein product [Mucor hiemalis]
MSVLPPTPGLQTTFEDNNEELLHLLTNAWENPLNVTESKWTRDYLTKLTTLSLEELLHEPAELREEQAKAERDAQQLAFRDYPSFLHAQTCRREAEETLDGLHVHLGEFITSVPELQQACEEFTLQATELKQERGKITKIPQLMETCVWNGYYSEAMDLASHVRLLQVRYPLPVVKSIQQQVQASSDLMLIQLISHLQKPIRLAASMNVVGFLRRMDVFESEPQLRLVFLRCRNEFLQQRLTRVKRDISEDPRQRSTDAFEYLKRYIDVIREQVFEIGTQYMSIFSNEQGSLLSDYMVNITLLIKSTLKTHLPMIEDTSALASLLSQLQYCGLSLGRIGLDFRHIFVQSFEEAVQPMILKWIDLATEDLVKIIVKSTKEASAPSTWMSSKTVSQSNEEGKRHTFQPPLLLVGYPSLAIFTNGILSAFNALRLLPALSLFLPIQNHLEACFLEIGNALKQYSDQAVSHIPDEIVYLQSFTAAFVRCCIPYLKFCLVDGIYSELSALGAVDEDLELLLVDYLPVVEKEHKEENLAEEDVLLEGFVKEMDEKSTLENSSLEEPVESIDTDTVKDADESITIKNTTLEEPVESISAVDVEKQEADENVTIENAPLDEPVASVNAVDVDKEETDENVTVESATLDEPVELANTDTVDNELNNNSLVESNPMGEIQEENPSKEEERTDKLINPKEDNEHDTSLEVVKEDETPKDTVIDNKVSDLENVEQEAAEDSKANVLETEEDSIDLEQPVQPSGAVAEDPLKEDKSVVIDSMVEDSSAPQEESEQIHATTTTTDNSTSEPIEQTDDKEVEEKPTPEKKQQSQQKKSKKHKGKKGRR